MSTTRIKRSKDHKAPKRPKSAFFLFLDKNREHFKSLYKGKNALRDYSIAISEKWKSLTPEERKPFEVQELFLEQEYMLAKDE